MARNSFGASSPGTISRRHHRRHREDHGIARAERDLVRRRNRAPRPCRRRNRQARSRWPKSHCGAVLAEKAQRRFDEGVRPSPSRAISGRQALPPAASVSRMIAPARRGAAVLRLGVERRDEQRPRQPLVERARAGHDLADGLVGGRPQQPRERQIVARARARHAPGPVENPPRQAARIDPQRPALAARRDRRRRSRRRADPRARPRRRSSPDRTARRDWPRAAGGCRCRSSMSSAGS